jgi:hypothetical protein
MSTLRGGSSIAALLAAAALALGACGGDDEGDSGTTGAATPTTTATTETGTTGTTERERTDTTGTREDRTSTRERGEGGGGSGGGGSNGGGSNGGSDDSGSTSQPPAQPGNVYKTAKTVCTGFLPNVIARELEKGETEPESVARDYSRGFPDRQQKRAYEGCLAGLEARSR